METPKEVNELNLIADCTNVESIRQWEWLMEGTTKANGKRIRGLIKYHLPWLYDALALDYPNPFENRCVKKPGLLVYVHSNIEYFLEYN